MILFFLWKAGPRFNLYQDSIVQSSFHQTTTSLTFKINFFPFFYHRFFVSVVFWRSPSMAPGVLLDAKRAAQRSMKITWARSPHSSIGRFPTFAACTAFTCFNYHTLQYENALCKSHSQLKGALLQSHSTNLASLKEKLSRKYSILLFSNGVAIECSNN